MEKKVDDVFFMQKALDQAALALERGDFPVGCVITDPNGIIAEGVRSGTAEGELNEVDHAEMVALRSLYDRFGKSEQDYSRFTIYSTLEPCLMCFGAILIQGIGRVVYAYEDAMGGGTRIVRQQLTPLYQKRQIDIVPYVLRSESLTLLHRFFENPSNHYWPDSVLANYTLKSNHINSAS